MGTGLAAPRNEAPRPASTEERGDRVTTRYVVRRAAEARYISGTAGLRTWSLVDEHTPGAVHTGFAVRELDPGGSIGSRVQSFEECVYLIDGALTLRTPEGAAALGPGDYALLPV